MRRFAMLMFLVMIAVPAPADTPPATGDAVAAELARLNTTLREIAASLRKQEELDGLALLVKRVELAEGKLVERENALKSARSEWRSLDGQRSQLETRLKMMADEAERRASDAQSAELDALTTQLEAELRKARQRAGELGDEIATLENSVASLRADLEAWQTVLDRRLSGR